MLNETWLAVKLKASKQQLQVVLIDFKVKMIFGSPHAILNNHHHIFRRLKINLKCFSINESHCTLRTALVCCCEFLRQYMYFSRTLCRLSWLQWTLDDSKLSVTSRIFLTTVSFLPAQFRHKMFVKSEPYLLSGDQFKIQTSFGLFCPPDIIHFRLKSLFEITLAQGEQI